ncbi:MAG: DUF1592 domain-containing protein, partial [Acidobacteria bacterium]|nr:DUF1592 domain-containing protein [Acidobacteriota bacterium]
TALRKVAAPAAAILWVLAAWQLPLAGQAPSAVSSADDARAILDRYCVGCHSDRLQTAGLTLQSVDLASPAAHAETLEKAIVKLRLGSMPPAGRPRPEPAVYSSLAGWLETELDRGAVARPNPGRTESLHRLNRTEYANVIRDLLDLEGLNFATLLPSDDRSYGFDNVAGALGMTPTHLERYLDAARQISRIAVGDTSLPPGGETFILPPDLSQDDRFEQLPFGTRGGTLVRSYFPADGDYIIRFQAFTGVGLSEEEPNFIEFSVDGERVFYEEMAQTPIRRTISGADIQSNTDWEIRVPINAGLRDVAVTFLKTTSGQLEDLLQPFLRPPGISSFRLTRMGGYSGPYIGQLSFTGPFDVTGPGDTPSRRRIFTCRPSGPADPGEEQCARSILSSLARRAYRRPVTDADLDVLLGFYRAGRRDGDFERGIQVALERLLASPDFLFRVVEDPRDSAPGAVYEITDLELASRLSFFLWSSIPDDELIEVASRGELQDEAVLVEQTRRMLADPRSASLITNFAGQWLRLRNLPGIDRDAHLFPDFDDNLRRAMRRETELLLETIAREDRSMLELLAADYTFVNERLARHYGIPNVAGSHFRRVPVTDPNRRGILGHASILTVTSQSNRTSPVTRGKWILENLLGAPPPAPPDEVPGLEETRLEGTLRERMVQHRRNPVCAACHQAMDPLGFSLENFSPLGEWRTVDAGFPVDAGGAMPDGITTFEGVSGLRRALLDKSDVFISTLTEKLLIYALGRGVEYYDKPTVRDIRRQAARHDYRFSALIEGIVTSAPFRMRTAD